MSIVSCGDGSDMSSSGDGRSADDDVGGCAGIGAGDGGGHGVVGGNGVSTCVDGSGNAGVNTWW